MSQVYYTVLMERTIMGESFPGLMDIATRAGGLGYTRISMPYTRVDVARNRAVEMFRSKGGDPNDLLIMLDMDHMHDPDILERLDSANLPVLAALAFRRGEPHDPQMYRHGPGGQLVQPSEWEEGPVRVDAFGAAALAIRRWVFDKLEEHGFSHPFFRFWYPKGNQGVFPSEDIFFGLLCEAAEIECYVDTRIECPHLTAAVVDSQTWKAYLADHPELKLESQIIPEDMREKVMGGHTHQVEEEMEVTA